MPAMRQDVGQFGEFTFSKTATVLTLCVLFNAGMLGLGLDLDAHGLDLELETYKALLRDIM